MIHKQQIRGAKSKNIKQYMPSLPKTICWISGWKKTVIWHEKKKRLESAGFEPVTNGFKRLILWSLTTMLLRDTDLHRAILLLMCLCYWLQDFAMYTCVKITQSLQIPWFWMIYHGYICFKCIIGRYHSFISWIYTVDHGCPNYKRETLCFLLSVSGRSSIITR